MISNQHFHLIKERHGSYASWAVWANGQEKPKDKIGDLSIFDPVSNPDLLGQLNPNIILLGLNISRPIENPLGNFHDARSSAMDYKIRYALTGTLLWGAYMTDTIKDFEQKISGKVRDFLRANPRIALENIGRLKLEIADLKTTRPVLIAFGRDSYDIVSRHMGNVFNVYRLPHYSNYGSKESYREEVLSCLAEFNIHRVTSAQEF